MRHPTPSTGLPSGNPPGPARGGPASGFILIVVMVLLLLMAIMVITWLGTVRYRVQTIDNGRGGNTQLVVASVVNDIGSRLTADYPSLDKANQPAPYDYPWTDTAVANLPFTCMRPAPGQARSGLTAGDPPHDDPWLASSLTVGGTWPHLSNLRGSFLDVSDADLTKVPLDYTRQYIPTDKPSAGLEVNVAANGARLVDTDGDGIGDALWFFPAVSTLGDRRYVAAVYIEDLSAKLNVNTALPLRAGGAYATDSLGGNAVPTKLGLTSGDVDLSAATVLWPAITDAQLNALLGARWGAPSPAAPAPPLDFLKRFRYWAERACRANADGTPKAGEDATLGQGLPATVNGLRFGLGDEFQMRINGGLANPKNLTCLETLDPNLKTALRAGQTENDYTAVAGSFDAYFRANPRRWLTAFSGESLDGVKGFDSNAAGTNPGFLPQGRFDLNAPVADPVYADIQQNWMGAPLYCGNDGISDGGGANDDHPYPKFFLDFIRPPGNGAAANTGNAAKWWAGNVAGNRMAATSRTPGTKSWNNLLPVNNGAAAPGPLPVLTEVYYQCFKAYKSKVAAGANQDVTVESLGATCGYCLEFSNPFAMPVQLKGVTWSMTDDDTYTAATTPDLEAEALAAGWPHTDENGAAVLLPGHKLLLWRDGDCGTATAPTAGSAMDNNLKMVGTKVAAAVASSPVDPSNAALGKTVHAVPSSLAFGPKGTAPALDYSGLASDYVKFQVNALQRGGATVHKAYQYLTLPVIHDTEVERVPGTWTMPAVGAGIGIAQCSARTWGLKEGLDVLQCRPARAPCATLDAKTTAGKIGWNGNTNRAIRGDAAICYNRAVDGTDGTLNAAAKLYDPSFFTSVANTPTLGLDDKTTGWDDRSGTRKAYGPAYAALGGATRPRINGDTWWFAGNDWYWGSDGKAHYRYSRRMAGAADLHRIPHVMLWPDGAATDKVRPGTSAGEGPGTKTGGGHYTDTDVAHWLFFALNQEIDAAGTVNASFTGGSNSTGNPRTDVAALMAAGRQPLDALRLHPWTDAGTFKNYAFPAPAAPATAPTSRNVPFAWMEELLYCVGKPGQTGGLNWQDASANPQLNQNQKWLSLGGNGYPLFADGTNWLEWTAENDTAQTTAHGKLNLNTAPAWLLEEALPIRDQAMRKAIADLIVQTRDNAPANAGTRAAGDRGLAYMAELIPVVAKAAKTGAIPNWPTVAGQPDVRLDTVLDILGPLWQTAGTRSDFFAAHILVQGFQANNFSTGAIESAKVLVIFRRDQSGTAVVGSYNY